MHTKKLLALVICCLFFYNSYSQQNETVSDVDAHSLGLYNAAQWKTLMIYGKEKISSGIDFPLLRMRTGYAAYMLGNFSESLAQYSKVFLDDKDNKLALYYVYLNNLYLNNETATRFYAAQLPAEMKASENTIKTKLSGIQTEYSLRIPNDTARRNAQYGRVGFNLDLGYRFQLQQSFAYYTLMSNTAGIANKPAYQRLQQLEYYGKLIYAANDKLSFIGAYHYISDHFRDTTLKTNIFLGGIKYSMPYFSIQANAGFGNFAVNYKQYDAVLTIYPLGNLNLYSISRISFGSQTNFTQVLGAKLLKGVWAEGNLTTGKASYLFDNDALYVKNDPDPNLFRCGGSVYTVLSKKLLLSINYTFEQKQKQFNIPVTNYFQNSINGGLTWKF